MVRVGVKRKSGVTEDYDPLIDGEREWDLQEKLDSDKYSAQFVDVRENGESFSLAELQRDGFRNPLLFLQKTGLGIRVPSDSFTVSDVKLMVGARRPVDVMDVRTQQADVMTMRQWADYYSDPNRDRILNVISLEFSHTKLDNYVESPTVVRQIDWIDRAWPPYLREKQVNALNSMDTMYYPKVRKYVLMSVAECYTDWHVDMGGTSVWYHVLRGRKIFWLVPPTEKNIQRFEKWTLSGQQDDTFFGDLVEKCQRVELVPGNTFFIPTGWLHAVYTPEDSLVFGGNYLHSFSVKQQLRIWEVEDKTRVHRQFRFPMFLQLHWYVLARYVGCLLHKEHVVPGREPDEELEAYAERMSVYKSQLKAAHVTQKVQLTQFEMQGISLLLQWLRQLPSNRREVPPDLPEPDRLLDDVQLLLKKHSKDSPDAACTGVPTIKWPADMIKDKAGVRNFGGRGRGRGRQSGVQRQVRLPTDKFIHRRVRCRLCEPCRRRDCRECVFCVDMAKYGGNGILKQCCTQKQCIACSLPAKAACHLCNDPRKSNELEKEEDDYDPDEDLFECGVCWKLAHPACIRRELATEAGVSFDPNFSTVELRSDQMPNYWCCPICHFAGRAGELHPRVPKGLKMLLKLENEQVESGRGRPARGKENSKVEDFDDDEVEESLLEDKATADSLTEEDEKPPVIRVIAPARKKRRTQPRGAGYSGDSLLLRDDFDDELDL